LLKQNLALTSSIDKYLLILISVKSHQLPKNISCAKNIVFYENFAAITN